MARIPAYKQMYVDLKQKIKKGSYKAGGFLPTEPELEKEYNVSRTTVRKAIGMLTAEGYLSVRQGRGTEIQDISTSQKLNKITSFTETLSRGGHKVTTQGLYVEKIPAPDFLMDTLLLKPGSMVHHIQRVQCTDEKAICIIENYLSAAMLPEFVLERKECVSLYAQLENNYGIVLMNAVEHITAVSASFIESQILQVPVGTPLLHSTRVGYTEQGPFEYSITNVIAERYEYQVYLTGRA